jgi:hypothetical protein
MNRRLKLAVMLTGASLVTGAIVYAVLPADAATATADIQFSRIDYNSPGKDTRSNASLNAEYVRITNRSAFSVNLSKWTLKDKQKHTFTFPAMTLRARQALFIHTGKGTATGKHLYWRSGNYVWNNTGDTATLRSASGRVYDVCSFKASGVSTNCAYKDPGPLPPPAKSVPISNAVPVTVVPSKSPSSSPLGTIPPGQPWLTPPPVSEPPVGDNGLPHKPPPTGPIESPTTWVTPPTALPPGGTPGADDPDATGLPTITPPGGPGTPDPDGL